MTHDHESAKTGLTRNQSLVFAALESPKPRSAPTPSSMRCAIKDSARRCGSIGHWKSWSRWVWCIGWKA